MNTHSHPAGVYQSRAAEEVGPPTRIQSIALLVGVTALGFFLRVYRVGARDYWQDEVFNVLKSGHLLDVLTGNAYVANHPPLFTVFVALGRYAGLGTNEGLLRLVPVLLGVATIPIVYGLTRSMFDRVSGLFAALFVAAAPLHVHHSQDLKVYILLPLTATLTAWALYQAVRTNARTYWVLYALAAASACYSDVFAAPFLVAVNSWALAAVVSRRDRAVPWLAANAVGTALFVPQLFVMIHRAEILFNTPEVWWIPPPSLHAFAFYLKAVAFGYSDSEPAFKVALALFLAMCCAGVVVGFRQRKWATLLLISWFAIAVAVVTLLSLATGQSLFLFRAMLPFAVPLYILCGLAVAAMRWSILRIGAIGVWVGLVGVSHADLMQDRFPPEELPHRPGIHPPIAYEEAVDYIQANWHDGDQVVVGSPAPWLSLYWYGLQDSPPIHAALDQEYIDVQEDLHPRDARNVPDKAFDKYFPIKVETALAEAPRVWYVFTDWERQYLSGHVSDMWRWFEAHYHQLDHRQYRGLELFYYANEIATVPVEPVARDQDTGVTSARVYRIGDEERRVKAMTPDAGTIPKPVAERRSELTLEFIGVGAGGPQGFVLRNEGKQEARAHLQWLQSAALVEAAGFQDQETWRVRAFPLHQSGTELYSRPVVCTAIQSNTPHLLGSNVTLAAGAYRPVIHFRNPLARARFGIQVGTESRELGVQSSQSWGEHWYWEAVPSVRLPAPASSLPLEIRPPSVSQDKQQRFCVDVIAFVPENPGHQNDQGVRQANVRLEPGERKQWPIEPLAGATRIDVWTVELAPNHHGLRIFYTGLDEM